MSQTQGPGGWKYPRSTLIKSSDGLSWSTLFADLRSHGRCDKPGTAAPDTEVGIVVGGCDEGFLTCKFDGRWHSARTITGSVWLRPLGGRYDGIRVDAPRMQVMHLYLPDVAFARLMDDDRNLPAVPGSSIRFACGLQDELITQIGLSVLSEMMCPTAAGRMFVETSSLLLAARLVYSHLETGPIRLPTPSQHRLDEARLRRVLAYIEDRLPEGITVADLSNVACLSIFHFVRAFAATMGVTPHRYVSGRRLESAKAMIATGRASLLEIALDSGFSSQSSFTRAFRRAMGVTPAEYRRALR